MCHESVQEVARRSQKHGTRRQRTAFETLYLKHGANKDRYTHSGRSDINNNPQETWGRTDYMKGDITGNTWDEIKIQTETN